MGNPDGDTPKHIVDKMVEVAQRPGTHGYSASRGIPRLRKAISDWYKRRWDVDIDPDKEAIVTIGSKEGIAHLMLATCDRGDTVLVPNPSYPIHIYGSIIAGADVRSVRMGPGIDFFSEFERAVTETTPKPKLMILGFPSNPTAQCVDLDFFENSSPWLRSTASTSFTTWPTPTSSTTDSRRLPSCRSRALKTWPSSSLR